MNRLFRSLLCLLLALGLFGCGQSGPLYLPEDPAEQSEQNNNTLDPVPI